MYLGLALLVAVGVGTGTLAGLLGIGGGTFIVPVLVLAAAMTQQQAEATSLAVILPTAIVASIILHRSRVGDIRTALALGLVGVIGAVGGASLALALPAETLSYLFAAFLAIVGMRLIRDAVAMGDDRGT